MQSLPFAVTVYRKLPKKGRLEKPWLKEAPSTAPSAKASAINKKPNAGGSPRGRWA